MTSSKIDIQIDFLSQNLSFKVLLNLYNPMPIRFLLINTFLNFNKCVNNLGYGIGPMTN